MLQLGNAWKAGKGKLKGAPLPVSGLTFQHASAFACRRLQLGDAHDVGLSDLTPVFLKLL